MRTNNSDEDYCELYDLLDEDNTVKKENCEEILNDKSHKSHPHPVLNEITEPVSPDPNLKNQAFVANNQRTTRYGRVIKPPNRYGSWVYN